MNNQTGKIFMLLGEEQSGRKTLTKMMNARIDKLRIIEDYIVFNKKNDHSILFFDKSTQIMINSKGMDDLIREEKIKEYKYLNSEYYRAAFPLMGYTEGLRHGDSFITYANLEKVKRFKEIFGVQFPDCIVPIYIYSTSLNYYSSRHNMIQQTKGIPFTEQYSSGDNLTAHSVQSLNGELDEIKRICNFEVLNDNDLEGSATKLMNYIKQCL